MKHASSHPSVPLNARANSSRLLTWRANFAVVMAIIILTALGVVSFLSIQELVRTSDKSTESHVVLTTIEDLFSQVKDAQRGMRGFVIRGAHACSGVHQRRSTGNYRWT